MGVATPSSTEPHNQANPEPAIAAVAPTNEQPQTDGARTALILPADIRPIPAAGASRIQARKRRAQHA